MKSISIIGVGRVGGALALGLSGDVYSIENLIYRSNENGAISIATLLPVARALGFDGVKEIGSEIVFITTPDAQIAKVAMEMVPKLSGNPYVFHTSGSLSSSVLENLRAAGCKTGSIHPLVSISTAEAGPSRFKGSYFCVEGSDEATPEAKNIIEALGGIPFTIDTNFKTLYHAAAVTACGHLVALFDAGVEMMTKCGLTADEAKNVLLPLVKSTVQNLGEQSTSAALTGTFARADTDTFVRHLNTLNTNVSDELLEIYLLLGERSLELAAKQGVNAERIESLRTKVSIAKSKLRW